MKNSKHNGGARASQIVAQHTSNFPLLHAINVISSSLFPSSLNTCDTIFDATLAIWRSYDDVKIDMTEKTNSTICKTIHVCRFSACLPRLPLSGMYMLRSKCRAIEIRKELSLSKEAEDFFGPFSELDFLLKTCRKSITFLKISCKELGSTHYVPKLSPVQKLSAAIWA